MPGLQEDPPKLEHVAPKWFKRYCADVRRWLINNRPVQGRNVSLSDAPGGGKLISVDIGSFSQTSPPHPFRVQHIKFTTATPKKPIFKLNQDSFVVKGFRVDDNVVIADVDDEFELVAGDKLFLEATIPVDPALITITLKKGTTWDGYPNPVEFDDPVADNKMQEKAWCLLAYVQETPDPNVFPDRVTVAGLQLVQCVTTHLLLCRTCHEADTVFLFHPFHAPGPAA